MRAPVLGEASRCTTAGPDDPVGCADGRSAGAGDRAESGAIRAVGASLGGMAATLRAARPTGDVVRRPASGFPAGRVWAEAGDRFVGRAVIVS
jgi:hypothetical protein